MVSEPIKGFSDYTGQEAKKRQKIKEIAEKIFRLYGFEPAETPIIESEEFVRGNNSNDEAVSDVYRLKDKGQRNLALRYEFTFQLKRISQNKKLPYRRYQIGPVFRDEPVSANRVRQITQCDVDIIGSGIKDDAEVLLASSKLLDALNIKYTIYVNNRKLLNQILEEQKVPEKDREAVIREIDKLDKLSQEEVRANLKKYNAEKSVDVFKKPEKYFEKYPAYQEIKELQKWCELFGVKAEFSPSLARGLAYYTGSVFEIKTAGVKETICGGGSYTINGIQATGISQSIERLFSLVKDDLEKEGILIISLDQDKKAVELAEKLRESGKPCIVMFGKPGKALEYANSNQIQNVIFVGEDEVKKKKFKLRNMMTGEEKLISEKEVVKKLAGAS